MYASSIEEMLCFLFFMFIGVSCIVITVGLVAAIIIGMIWSLRYLMGI